MTCAAIVLMGAPMLDRPEQSAGKINWPMAIGLSAAVHVVALGIFWMASGPSSAPSAAEDGVPAAESARANAAPADGGEVRPPEAADAPSADGAQSGEATADYVVKPGDFPNRIARTAGCTLADLKRLNGAAIEKTLHPGQILKVPAK